MPEIYKHIPERGKHLYQEGGSARWGRVCACPQLLEELVHPMQGISCSRGFHTQRRPEGIFLARLLIVNMFEHECMSLARTFDYFSSRCFLEELALSEHCFSAGSLPDCNFDHSPWGPWRLIVTGV